MSKPLLFQSRKEKAHQSLQFRLKRLNKPRLIAFENYQTIPIFYLCLFMKSVAILFSVSGSPYFSFPKAMDFVKKMMFLAK